MTTCFLFPTRSYKERSKPETSKMHPPYLQKPWRLSLKQAQRHQSTQQTGLFFSDGGPWCLAHSYTLEQVRFSAHSLTQDPVWRPQNQRRIGHSTAKNGVILWSIIYAVPHSTMRLAITKKSAKEGMIMAPMLKVAERAWGRAAF